MSDVASEKVTRKQRERWRVEHSAPSASPSEVITNTRILALLDALDAAEKCLPTRWGVRGICEGDKIWVALSEGHARLHAQQIPWVRRRRTLVRQVATWSEWEEVPDASLIRGDMPADADG